MSRWVSRTALRAGFRRFRRVPLPAALTVFPQVMLVAPEGYVAATPARSATPEFDVAGLIPWALLAAIVWGVGYLAACWWWPFTYCRRCDGDGRFRSPSGRAWRRCKRCGGTGARLRTGRRIYNWWTNKAADAS